MAHICMIHVYIYNYVHINTVLLELQRKYNIIIARRVKAFASCSHQTLDCAIGARESNKINNLYFRALQLKHGRRCEAVSFLPSLTPNSCPW